jgi:hypothetical protein
MSDSSLSVSKKNGARPKRQENKSQSRTTSASSLGKHELVRLLSAGLEMPVPADTGRFSERLTRHLEFTNSLKLSEVPVILKRIDSASVSGSVANTATDAGNIVRQVEAALQRVQHAIAVTIAQSFESEPAQARIPLPQPRIDNERLTLAVYLNFYQAHQQEMSAKIQGLRRYLRDTLAPFSSRMAQLVYLDTTLEETVGLPLRSGFQAVSTVLQAQISKTEQCFTDVSPENLATVSLEPFYRQLRQLLTAECDLRLQPVMGLVEAFKQEVDQTS